MNNLEQNIKSIKSYTNLDQAELGLCALDKKLNFKDEKMFKMNAYVKVQKMIFGIAFPRMNFNNKILNINKNYRNIYENDYDFFYNDGKRINAVITKNEKNDEIKLKTDFSFGISTNEYYKDLMEKERTFLEPESQSRLFSSRDMIEYREIDGINNCFLRREPEIQRIVIIYNEQEKHPKSMIIEINDNNNEKIFDLYIKNVKFNFDKKYLALLKQTSGSSVEDLKTLAYESKKGFGTVKAKKNLTIKELEEAIRKELKENMIVY